MSSSEAESPPAVDETAPAPVRGATPLRVLGLVVMVALALFWAWIFSGAARKQNPDYLEDREWVARAEATCRAAQDIVDERDNAEMSATERADAIDVSSAELRAMVDDLRSPLPRSEADLEVVEPWLADWETLLADRDRYTAALRVNEDARFLTTEKFNDPIGTVIKTFATVNEMPSCGPPGDVA